MIIDRTKNSIANFFALVKASNPSITLTDQNAIIGVPEAVVGPNGTNTKVVISSVKNKGFSGTREVYYKRCTLTEGLVNPITSLTVNVGELVGAFASRLLVALNVLEPEVTVNAGAGFGLTGNQVLASKADSLVYLPNQSHTVNAVSLSFAASFEMTLGAYTAVPFKESVAQSRWQTGIVGSGNFIDLDTSRSIAAGTFIGSFQKNPNNSLASFFFAPSTDYSPGGNMSIKYLPVGGLFPPAGTVRLTNLITGASLTASVQVTDNRQTDGHVYYTFAAVPAHLSTIGITGAGSRLGVDFL